MWLFIPIYPKHIINDHCSSSGLYVPSKRRYLSTSPHVVTTQNTNIQTFTTLRTSNLTTLINFMEENLPWKADHYLVTTIVLQHCNRNRFTKITTQHSKTSFSAVSNIKLLYQDYSLLQLMLSIINPYLSLQKCNTTLLA